MPEFNLLQFDKNDLKESLIPKEQLFKVNYVENEINYVAPKQSYSINDFEEEKSNNLVESKQYQLNFMSNPETIEKVEKIKVDSNNSVVQNESCCFCSKNKQPQMSSMNYTFNGGNKPNIVYTQQPNYVNQAYQMNYNINRQGVNQVSSTPTTINYSFQPTTVYPNFSQQSYQIGSQTNTFNYVTVPNVQQRANNSAMPQQAMNVISYSFNSNKPEKKVEPKKVNVMPINDSGNYNSVGNTANNNVKVNVPNSTTTKYCQLDCSKCKTKLAYPEGSSGVFCPLCRTVNSVVKMDFIICGKCKVTLKFPSGAQYVKCQACSVVNLNPSYVKK